LSKSISQLKTDSKVPQAPCNGTAESCLFMHELETVKEELVGLTALVRTDELTGLFNFRHFQQSIDLEMERTRRSGHAMSLLMMDIDFFKKLNDRWGHECGNFILKQVSRIIEKTLRRLDTPCRYGGEEFAIILPDTSLHAAINLADRLRHNIQDAALVFNGETVPVTISIGVDVFTSNDNDDVSRFVARTDAWLYAAKQAGRNRVHHAVDREETHVSKEERDFLLGGF
jgi:diguanylate cyclase (GGDEF)-like protein